MQASRLLSILMLLQSRGRLTAGALAQTLEVSERTILRDIDQLSAAGVPLWGERGRQGGFQLRAGWSTQLTGMTEPEANALMLAGLPGPATELGLGEAAASARLKLVASLPAPWREQAARVAERLHVDPVDWYRTQDTPAFLREAAEAVWQGKRISVTYRSWRGDSRRELEPLGLVLKGGAWYLAARQVGKQSVRTYRLASMLDLTGGRSFKRPRDFHLGRYWQESSARFESELRPLQVRVSVSPRAMGWLIHSRSRFVALPNPPEDGPPGPAGWRQVLLPLESIEHGARQILGYGTEVEVVEPAELRAELAQIAGQLLKHYVPAPARGLGRGVLTARR